MSKLGVLALARPTFDVEYAEANLEEMFLALDRCGVITVGPRTLLMDGTAARSTISDIADQKPDQVLILQVTFTDAAITVEIADRFDVPLSIWSIPEPRLGGRLRLNSFCGLNLAAHALGLNDREFGYLYSAAGAGNIDTAIKQLLTGGRQTRPIALSDVAKTDGAGSKAVEAIRGAKIGRIGAHPDGFHTCAYDKAKLKALANVSVDEIELSSLFETAGQISDGETSHLRSLAEAELTGLGDVNQVELDRSLKLKKAIGAIKSEGDHDAFAIRCWPETFTEYGGAVCGPVSMMGEAKVPCACEADVYGALTSLLLQKVVDAPVFLADLVDLDEADDTGVVWHCGQAPISMADPEFVPRATIHTNRKMPLLYEFPLKPGQVTLFRISQARGQTFAVIGRGEMLRRPMAFTGTSGVVRFESGASTVFDRIMGAALEHHMALAYGDHREALKSAAAALGVPVLEL